MDAYLVSFPTLDTMDADHLPPCYHWQTSPVCMQGGFIWLFWGKLSADQRPPIPFVPELEDRSWRPVYGSMEFECPHWGVFENAIDVAHIHSLHTSDFGNQERPEIQIIHDPAVKRDEAQGVTMQFALHNKATNPVWRLFQVRINGYKLFVCLCVLQKMRMEITQPW